MAQATEAVRRRRQMRPGAGAALRRRRRPQAADRAPWPATVARPRRRLIYGARRRHGIRHCVGDWGRHCLLRRLRNEGAANASSSATTNHGAIAQAQSTAAGSSGAANSTAETSFTNAKVLSTTSAPTGSTATTDAIAQAGEDGQAFSNPGQTAYAFSVGAPDKAYATSLIEGAGAEAVADKLGPRDAIFGAAILGANYAQDGGGESLTYSATSTFDFGHGGDLQLGLIDSQRTGFVDGGGFQSLEFYVIANNVEIVDQTFGSLALADQFFQDQVIDLGSSLGPNVALTFGYNLVASGSGGYGVDFAVGGAVPEPSTWVMLLAGLGGLGLAGYRRVGSQPPHEPSKQKKSFEAGTL